MSTDLSSMSTESGTTTSGIGIGRTDMEQPAPKGLTHEEFIQWIDDMLAAGNKVTVGQRGWFVEIKED